MKKQIEAIFLDKFNKRFVEWKNIKEIRKLSKNFTFLESQIFRKLPKKQSFFSLSASRLFPILTHWTSTASYSKCLFEHRIYVQLIMKYDLLPITRLIIEALVTFYQLKTYIDKKNTHRNPNADGGDSVKKNKLFLAVWNFLFKGLWAQSFPYYFDRGNRPIQYSLRSFTPFYLSYAFSLSLTFVLS